jgi:hypothetical protein
MPPRHSASAPCLPGDHKAYRLPDVARACSSRDGVSTIHLPGGYSGAVLRRPQPPASNWAGQSAPLIVGLFIKDLMQDIKNVTPIKDGEDKRLMDYYVMLQSHIAEARNTGLLEMLLIPANVEMMVLPLSNWPRTERGT